MSKSIKIQMDKFPYLHSLKVRVSDIKSDIENLNERLPLIEQKLTEGGLTPLERNELKEKKNKLPRKLRTLYTELSKSESQFTTYHDVLKKMIPDVNTKYYEVHEAATKVMLSGNEAMKAQFDQFKIYNFNDNWEAKVNFYAAMIENMKPALSVVKE